MKETMRILVTGGAGFIGSNFIRHLLRNRPQAQVINLDLLTYAGNLANLHDLQDDPRYQFVRGDITIPEDVEACFAKGVDLVVNFAAESHVDRSILDSRSFVHTNVLGAQNLLEAARRHGVRRFLQISTDEVYGSLGETGRFTEASPLQPNSPYAASKAAADLMVRSFSETYSLDVVITRCSNNYGPYQFPEKLIPLMVLNALAEKPLPVYGDGLYTRDWIHVEDHCRALESVLDRGEAGAVYNIGSDQEEKNIAVVQRILEVLGKSKRLIRHVGDRPGHDRRYAIDAQRVRSELGWTPQIPFERGLLETIEWYRTNAAWVEGIRTQAYRSYYREMYEMRERMLEEVASTKRK